MRIALIIWFCLGALGLGLVTLEASRRKVNVSGTWYFLAVLLGPIFLFFILPLWLGRWGRDANRIKNKL
ncbi:MAG: hypothetical protein A2Z97_00350 [Bdellovibrionales bacterium GWB1_52_6]|nr:MAG: hypothetical protein A2Z97_00350 [Bdellovibrionales bacterium GWB1_52_6]